MAHVLSVKDFGGNRRPPAPPRIERPSRYLASVSRAGAAEVPLVVQFTGLTDSEQRAALNAFPGGKRFVLVSN